MSAKKKADPLEEFMADAGPRCAMCEHPKRAEMEDLFLRWQAMPAGRRHRRGVPTICRDLLPKMFEDPPGHWIVYKHMREHAGHSDFGKR